MYLYLSVLLVYLQTVGVGTTIARVMAIDDDLSNNGILTYSLTQLNPNNPTPSFTIHPLFGDLSVSNTIDADIDYQLIITATVRRIVSQHYLHDNTLAHVQHCN